MILMVLAFLVPGPQRSEPQCLRKAWLALHDRKVSTGMWLVMLAGIAFGVVDVLAPLRLSHLGATAVVIGATFLAAAVIESVLSPIAGRLSDRRGALVPVQFALMAAVAVSLLAPVLAPAPWLVALLVAGMPFYGTLYAPATALLSLGAQRLELNQALAFGMANLAWAGGQAAAAAASGALAQATSDVVPYALLAGACLVTLVALRVRFRAQALTRPGDESP
jgi:MFS family permease